MPITAIRCFRCGRLAKRADCELRRHQVSKIRRWFHRPGVKEYCDWGFLKEEQWELVDQSLGESTDEEVRSIGNVMLHLQDNKN